MNRREARRPRPPPDRGKETRETVRQAAEIAESEHAGLVQSEHLLLALVAPPGDHDSIPRRGYNAPMTVATSGRASTVGVRELKNQLSGFLDRVKAGEEITVTEHGRPIARLSAVGVDIDRMADLIESGSVRPAASSQRQLPKKRVRLTGGSSSLADIVTEQRG